MVLIGPPVAAEYKLDGERLQMHKDGDKVEIFSRRLERITYNYPDVVEDGATSGDYLSGFLQGTRRALHDNDRESVTITIPRVAARTGSGASPSEAWPGTRRRSFRGWAYRTTKAGCWRASWRSVFRRGAGAWRRAGPRTT